MANLYSGGTYSFTGYKTLSELTGLTFVENKVYTVQIKSDSSYYVREGTEGIGFEDSEHKPFTWTYDGINDLYIGNTHGNSIYINVAS